MGLALCFSAEIGVLAKPRFQLKIGIYLAFDTNRLDDVSSRKDRVWTNRQGALGKF